MRDVAVRALDRLTAADLGRVEAELARELTEAARGGAGLAFEDDEVARLRADLRLTGVVVLPDATVMLRYAAPTEYPDGTVCCQLDEDLAIDDISVTVDRQE